MFSTTPPRPPLARRFFAGWEGRDVAPLVSLVVLVAFFSLAAKNFLEWNTATNILKQGSVRGIVAVGLTYVLLCGEIDLAVGYIALWAACLSGWLFQTWAGGVDPSAFVDGRIAAIVVAALASCLVLGLATGGLTMWTGLPSFIISLAMMYIAYGAAQYLTKGNVQPVPASFKVLGNGGIHLGRLMLPYIAVLAAAVFLVGHFVLRYTRFGRYVYATGGNRQAARLNGIPTGRIVVACMAVSGVAAGLAGMLNAGQLNTASLDQNADLLLSAVACVVLGGTSLFGGEGSIGKTVIGVFTYTILSIGLDQIPWIDNFARQFLTGIVLMAALVINGVLARKR
jgi:ribose transport system permease protein